MYPDTFEAWLATMVGASPQNRPSLRSQLRSAVLSITFRSSVLLAGIASAVGTGAHLSAHPCYDVFGATRSGFAACASSEAIAIVDFIGLLFIVFAGVLGIRSLLHWRGPAEG